MKTIKQLREEYDHNILPQVIPEDLVLEASSSKIKKASFDIPSSLTMPSLLMFRRVTYRRFPDGQTVALYYSKSVDKYLSVPFGPTGNLNLSETTFYDTLEEFDLKEGAKWQAAKGAVKGAVQGAAKGFFKGNAIAAEPGMAIGAVVGGVHGAYKGAKKAYQKAKEQDKDMNEDWQSVNRKDKTDGLSQAAVNAYRRENPGSKLQTAVTEKNPKGKRASRRKSFCSRMSGMKKRLTSAKTARDPDSRINKALRRWNCEESFRQKLYEKRMQNNEGVIGDTIEKGRKWAQDKVKDSSTFKTLQDIGHQLPGYENVKKAKEKFSKGEYWDAAKETGKSLAKAAATGAGVAGAAYLGVKALPKIAGAVSGDGQGEGSKNDSKSKMDYKPEMNFKKVKVKTNVPQLAAHDSAIDDSRRTSLMRKEYESSKKQVSENKISDIRAMVLSEDKLHEMTINGRTVTLNNSMAKRILEVYDSVNNKNKKIVESMLNGDLESFKKLLNFSIRN